MTSALPPLLLPDAGPLITLAYADALDVLFKPGWPVHIVDMVQVEVTRHVTQTSKTIEAWVKKNKLHTVPTKMHERYQRLLASNTPHVNRSNLGEFAIQEAMNEFAMQEPAPIGVFLFEDHKIARSSFLLPPNCRKVSTRAFLIFLEKNGWLESAAAIERQAIQNGRNFAQIHFDDAAPSEQR